MLPNYIRHLETALSQLDNHPECTARHISLYMALFRRWNAYRFPADMFIFRDEMMLTARIGSRDCYLRSLRELEMWGLLLYNPSHNPNIASRVALVPLDQQPYRSTAMPANGPNEEPPADFASSCAQTTWPEDGSSAETAAERPEALFDKQESNYSKPLTNQYQTNTSAVDEALAVDWNGKLLSKEVPQQEADACERKKKVARKKKESTPETLFLHSYYHDPDAFIQAFAGTEYAQANLLYYREKLLNWRDKRTGEAPLRRDWVATARTFMLNDIKNDQLVLTPQAKQYAHQTDLAMFGADLDQYLARRYAP